SEELVSQRCWRSRPDFVCGSHRGPCPIPEHAVTALVSLQAPPDRRPAHCQGLHSPPVRFPKLAAGDGRGKTVKHWLRHAMELWRSCGTTYIISFTASAPRWSHCDIKPAEGTA